jgi:hypothetical protein
MSLETGPRLRSVSVKNNLRIFNAVMTLRGRIAQKNREVALKNFSAGVFQPTSSQDSFSCPQQ